MAHNAECKCKECEEDRYYEGLGKLVEESPILPAGRLGAPISRPEEK